MSCVISAGYTLGCRDSIGGIQEVYIGNFNKDVTYSLSASTDAIQSFTGGTVSYYTFQQEIETGSFEPGKMTASNETGSVMYEQTLVLTFIKLDGTLKNQMKLLAQGNLSVIVLDQRGVYHLMGKQNGVRATEGSAGVGKAFGDLNGFTITLVAKEPNIANDINQTAAKFNLV